MKIASIIAVVAAVVAGAFYFSQSNRSVCGDDILASNIIGCDIKGSTK